jgi:hypothetical protein
MSQPRKMPVVFYRTTAGEEVVRNWLLGLNDSDRNAIGQDLMRVQCRWPIELPLCRARSSDAAVAPDRHFYAAVSWAAFNALSCPPSAHLEKKI